MRESIPWWLKICAKLGLARLPIPYQRWRSVGFFKHGFMLDPEYALRVFQKHYDWARSYLPSPFSLLELGPGASLATSLIAAAHGATKIYLVDVGPFAMMQPEPYNHLSQTLALLSSSAVPETFRTVPEMLGTKNATYLISGIKSLRSIPDRSVDFVFSQAVLERIPLPEFIETVRELFRLQKPGGIASHRIDLQDHLSHGLNSLRFSRRVWESKLLPARDSTPTDCAPVRSEISLLPKAIRFYLNKKTNGPCSRFSGLSSTRIMRLSLKMIYSSGDLTLWL